MSWVFLQIGTKLGNTKIPHDLFASLRFLGSPISGSPSHRAVGFMTPCGKANRGKPNLVVFSSWNASLQKMLKQKLNYPLHCLMVKVPPVVFRWKISGETLHWRPASEGYAAGRPAAKRSKNALRKRTQHEESGKVQKMAQNWNWIIYNG